MKTKCLLFYFQTDLYAENNDLMRLLTNRLLTSLGLKVLCHQELGQMLLRELQVLCLWAVASSPPVNATAPRNAKLMSVHANNSKSTSHLPHRFLLPLLMNVTGFPLKGKWLCLDARPFKQNQATGWSPLGGKQSWKCSCCVHKVCLVCKNTRAASTSSDRRPI